MRRKEEDSLSLDPALLLLFSHEEKKEARGEENERQH